MHIASSTRPTSDMLGVLKSHFSWAERIGFSGSPLYSSLCRGIARDNSLLRLAADGRPGEPPCFLLMGALEYLGLLPLSSMAQDRMQSLGDIDTRVREIWLDNSSSIREVIQSRRVQTNEVGRSRIFSFCAGIAFAEVGAHHYHQIDLGCSAGLNLHWDKYVQELGLPRAHFSSSAQAKEIGGETLTGLFLRGRKSRTATHTVQEVPFGIVDRVGIDVEPVNLASYDEYAWLKALIWADQPKRKQRFDQAVTAVASRESSLIKADASEVLAEVCLGLHGHDPVFVTHSYLMDKLNNRQKQAIYRALLHSAESRPTIEIGMEYCFGESRWLVALWSRPGTFRPQRRLLAHGGCHPHGDQISFWG